MHFCLFSLIIFFASRFYRTIAAQENLPYSEYWDFLECHLDLCTKAGLEKLEEYLKNRSKRTRLCKTQVKKKAKSNGTPISRAKLRQIADTADIIKRRLSFENDAECTDNKLSNSPSFSSRKVCSSPPRSCSSTDEECFCRCGRLLGNCDNCSIEIDIENLIVSFRMCCTIKDDSFTDSVDGEFAGDVTESGDVFDGTSNEFDSPMLPKEDVPEVYIYGYAFPFNLLIRV